MIDLLNDCGFDEWSKDYESDVNESYNNKTFPFDGYYDVLARVLEHIKPNSKVLDVGFGTGVLTERISNLDCEIFGIDFSTNMTDIAKRKMPQGRFFECDFNNDLPEEILQEKYDHIIATYSLHHVDDSRKIELIETFESLLRDKGNIVIGDIMFGTEQELLDCKDEREDYEEEYYIIFDTFVSKLPKKAFTTRFEKMGKFAGVLIIEK